MLLNEKIRELIETDDGYKASYDKKIISIYNEASDNEKSKIDDIFLYITGFSLETIINRQKTGE